MKKTRRIRRSAVAWRDLFSRQARSGVSVAEFCRGERINAALFRRWRVLLKKETEQEPGHASLIAPIAEAAPFIDLGGIGPGGSRFEVRLELGAGLVLSIARS
jgi:hypothetical protein